MSSRLGTYFSIASISTFDFFLGISIAKITDYIFPAPTEDQSILKLFFASIGQLVTCMTLAFELRGLLLTERKDFFDPTGGVAFVLSIRAMPTFWKRIDLLSEKVLTYIFHPHKNIGSQDNSESGPMQAQNLNAGNAPVGGSTTPAPTSVPSSIVQSVRNAQSRYIQQ